MKTPMISKAISSAQVDFESSDVDVRTQYPANVLESSTKLILTVQENPDKVVNAIVRSVECHTPPRNNFVGFQAAILRVLALLPGWLVGFLSTRFRAKSSMPTDEALLKIQGSKGGS